MLVLILGLVLFLGIHSARIIGEDFRNGQIAKFGADKWKGIYSIISLIGFVLIIWGYALARPEAALLYEPPVWMKHINALLMWLSFIALAASGGPAGKIKPMLKHPMLVGVKLWAFGHLLANGDLASVLLFGSFLVWAIVDRISCKRRGDLGATVAGPLKNDLVPVVGGTVLYLLFIWKLHAWLFGVTPL